MTTTLTWHQQMQIAAGILARTNMGADYPSVEMVRVCLPTDWRRASYDYRSFVYDFCQELMETDEHEEMFLDEGKGFLDMMTENGEKRSKELWPRVFELIDKASD